MDADRSRDRWMVFVLGVVVAGALMFQAAAVLVVMATAHGLVGRIEEALSVHVADRVDAEIEAGFEASTLAADDPLLATRTIVVTHGINERTAADVIARLMVLDARDPGVPIDLVMSTQGGWVDAAFAIVDVMHDLDSPVNTWAVGGCYSAGTLIVAAGTGHRVASENALLMVHANLDEPSHDGTWESLEQARYERLWRRVATLPEEWYPMTFDRTHYLGPDDAVRYGLVDEVRRPAEMIPVAAAN
jgi:ATP-dependent Clp protease protease subunit